MSSYIRTVKQHLEIAYMALVIDTIKQKEATNYNELSL